MGLKERITDDLKSALKSGDAFKLGVLRLISAAIHNREIEARAKTGADKISEEEVQKVIAGEAKKRKEAIDVYGRGGRADLAGKEKRELAEIQAYLPAELSKEETEKRVNEIIAALRRTQGDQMVNFGSAMKAVMAELRGQADAKLVGEIIKRIVGSSNS